MNPRRIAAWLLSIILIAIAIHLLLGVDWEKPKPPPPSPPPRSEQKPIVPSTPAAGDKLLEGYGDPSAAPIEDLRKLQRVITGYHSVIKDASRFPIGGNADLTAALTGQNANREVFVSMGNPIIRDGLLTDRWGTPLIVHPEAWRQLELRSPGPDRVPHNDDDVILRPDGSTGTAPDHAPWNR
jgi:hypothetical protein